MPQIRENEHVVSRPRLILNDKWSGVSQFRNKWHFTLLFRRQQLF